MTNELGDQLSLEPSQDRLIVLNSEQQVKQVIEFSDLSGDWRWTTFSADSHYLLIALPYNLLIYRWRSPYNIVPKADGVNREQENPSPG
ncbi:MAG: hypothetical protein VKK04_21555 [Synechococcales bacterium]|nr:hypothetical protein [Synechococcales bacterium]